MPVVTSDLSMSGNNFNAPSQVFICMAPCWRMILSLMISCQVKMRKLLSGAYNLDTVSSESNGDLSTAGCTAGRSVPSESPCVRPSGVQAYPVKPQHFEAQTLGQVLWATLLTHPALDTNHRRQTPTMLGQSASKTEKKRRKAAQASKAKHKVRKHKPAT